MVNLMKQQNKQIKKPIVKTQTKSLLEDWQSFRAYQEALYNAQGKRAPML
jgi:hypothetical protein